MAVPCGGCGRSVRQEFPVSKSCLLFDKDTGDQLPYHNDVWICFVDGCDGHCCTSCYMTHIESKHPELYSGSCTTCQKQTLYKDFVEYGVCRSCVEQRAKEEQPTQG